MACYHPLSAYQTVAGDILFYEKGTEGKSESTRKFYEARNDKHIKRYLTLPCGQCIGCRLERSRQWAMRIMHEASMHDHSCFITLTYNDDNQDDPSLNYRHFQLFMKKLRFHFRGQTIKFYMCGEYGDTTGRRHFHACLFGVNFEDKEVYRELPSGHTIYTSNVLADLWDRGFCSIGELTFESAAYVARYVCKKVTGKNAEEHYTRFDPYTGEVFQLVPEFSHMSNRPGIGADWYRKFSREVYGRDGSVDSVVINGKEVKPPRYYDNLLKTADNFNSDVVEWFRQEKAKKFAANNTPERLLVRETCAIARNKLKKRSL